MRRWDHALQDVVRRRTSLRGRRRLAFARLAARRRLPLPRVLPDALVIGAQRGGTSSLYTYLGRHPDVSASLRKEVGYFTSSYADGEGWYRAHFPVAVRAAAHQALRGRPLLTFEATPDYLLDPRAAARAAALVPDARIVVLLREPADRAWSHWAHMRRRGHERLSFADALAAEPERLGGALERLATVDPLDRERDEPLARRVVGYSYRARGHYAEQLERWLAHFPGDRVLIVRSEDFYADTRRVFASVVEFLGLPAWSPERFPNVSATEAPPAGALPAPALDEESRRRLEEEFQAGNERLLRRIGIGWGRAGGAP